MTVPDMEGEEGNPISDSAHILAALFPALLKLAHLELEAAGHAEDLAEDMVQEAAASWFELVSTEYRAHAYMRKAIKNQVADLRRPHRDVLDHAPLSFGDQIEDL